MLQTTATLLAFLFPLAYSPGPGNMFFAATAARFGFAATLRANAGYHLATWAVTAAIGAGFAAAAHLAPPLLAALKTGGSLYVLWLAWKLFRAGTAGDGQQARAAGFRDGVILLIQNPKAYMIIALMFTQFPAPSEQGRWGPVLLLSTVFTLNNLCAFTVWAWIGDRSAAAFRRPENTRLLNRICGIILASVALWMLAAA